MSILLLGLVTLAHAGEPLAEAPPPSPPDPVALLDELGRALGAAGGVVTYEAQSIHWDAGQALEGYGTAPRRYADVSATVTYAGSEQLHLELVPRPIYPVQWTFAWTETIVGDRGFRRGGEAFGGPRRGVLTTARVAFRRKLHAMGAPEVLVASVLHDAELEGVWVDGAPALSGHWDAAPMRVVLDPDTHLPVELRVVEDVAMFGDAWHVVRYDTWTDVDGLTTPSSLTWSLDGHVVQEETRTSHRIVDDRFDPTLPASARAATVTLADVFHGTHRARFYLDFALKSFAKDQHTTDHPFVPVEMSDDTWFLMGPLYSVLATDLGDQIVLMEAPYAPEKAEATLAFVEATWPGRDVGAAGLSHGHFDHISGARAYMARDIALYIPERHAEALVAFGERPRTLFPDLQSEVAAPPRVRGLPLGETVIEGTAGRSIELHVVACAHSEEMLLAYLPHEKTLFVTDLHSPGIPPTRGPIGALAMGIIDKQLPLAMDFFAQGADDLATAVEELGLDVDVVLGGHAAWKTGKMKDVHALRRFHARDASPVD